MSKSISQAGLIKLVGAVVTVIFSFLNFVEFGGEGRNVWSSEGLRWVSTIPALLAIAMIVVSVLQLTGQKLPDKVLTFDWKQITATWGIAATGNMLAWLITDFGGLDKGIGFWGMLLGSAAMAVGAIMDLLGKGAQPLNVGGGASSPTAAPPPPPPFGSAPPPPPPPPVG